VVTQVRAGVQAPPDAALPLYLAYAKLEEDFGLARHAMAVYDRAVKAVADTDKMKVYEIYIARAAEFFGATRTRDIYEVSRPKPGPHFQRIGHRGLL
jgi:pre-mRNA-splicing factor SYF1